MEKERVHYLAVMNYDGFVSVPLFKFSWLIKGNLADTRMRAVSKRRGVEITSLSRPLRPSDFRDFDIILAMDKQNRGRRNLWNVHEFSASSKHLC